MWRIFIGLLFLCTARAFCDVSQADVWSCLLQNTCINKYQLHKKLRTSRPGNLRRQFLMAVEGSKYHKLFENCDTDKNGCISLNDITSAGEECRRSCIWRQTMSELLC